MPAFICLILLAATNGAIAFAVQPLMDDVFISKDAAILYLVPFAVMGIFLVRGAAFFVQSYLLEFVGLKVVRTLQIVLYNHIISMDMQFHTSNSTGGLISRITNDVNQVRSSASDVITNILREGFSIIFLVGVLFHRDAELALISLVGLPVAGYLIIHFGREIRKLTKNRLELMEGVLSHVEESFSGIPIVKAFCMESYLKANFRKITKDVLINLLKVAKISAINKPSMDLVSGLAIGAVVFYGGSSIISGETTPGAYLSFLTALLMSYSPVKRFSNLNNSLQGAMAAAQRIFEMLDNTPKIQDLPNAKVLAPIEKSLVFNQVDFAYGEGQSLVIQGFDLEIKAGETVAFVGPSGAGKTSIVQLVPRFYDVNSGKLMIDGQDIRECTLKSLRSQIAIVTQETILFNDTIRNNISFGDVNQPTEKIMHAAKMANALDFIMEMPDGFDTVIGDRGVRLSGGQRQRLSIARSLLKNAPILILDEATSALDTESERAVQGALEYLMQGRTTLVIAHRLSTIINADRIVFLQDGAILEEGTHDSLFQKDGAYAKYYQMQYK
ncbi:MAG: ATP-binding cassette domain-containing protein [Magnetococcales bacterium]|nr:ATP-binding cassette domain-containing protein [Magnetococcales bacterium]